jgi:hypothetical protein
MVATSCSKNRGGPLSLAVERGDQKQIGNARAEIATRIVRLRSEYYGKGPTKAKAYLTDDVAPK